MPPSNLLTLCGDLHPAKKTVALEVILSYQSLFQVPKKSKHWARVIEVAQGQISGHMLLLISAERDCLGNPISVVVS